MRLRWTFRRQVASGFVVILLVALAIGVVAVVALHSVEASKNQITGYAGVLDRVEDLRALRTQRGVDFRDYTLTHDASHLAAMRSHHDDFTAILTALRTAVGSGQEQRLIDAIESTDTAYQQQVELNVVTANATPVGTLVSNTPTIKLSTALDASITALVNGETALLNAASTAASRTASTSVDVVAILAAFAVVAGVLVAVVVTRNLSRQVGTAVSRVQLSAAELETAAHHQATGAKEEAAAMTQITATMTELLASSRQIAQSAQRVSQVAEATAAAAQSGADTVNQTSESVVSMRQQVDLIVGHMLELGRKSQQIGAILDIVSELAEQTNILAINATIEAAGAGESGARFAVVADEIRNLADRVSGSAKEIRDLIDEVRAAVNTTVMATETGSKTVQAGSAQFAAVAEAFRRIAALLDSTTEAAREIELSTKQQTTAVEQVNVGVSDVAQTTRQTEASAAQTRQTAAELVDLSSQLHKLVHPRAS